MSTFSSKKLSLLSVTNKTFYNNRRCLLLNSTLQLEYPFLKRSLKLVLYILFSPVISSFTGATFRQNLKNLLAFNL